MEPAHPTRSARRGPDVPRSACPVARSLDVLGDRWTLLVIRDLLTGPRRFGDLLAAPERIPTNVLTDRLRRLEREGIVRAEPYSEHPPRFEYTLTRKGRELGPALDALASWGLHHFPGTVRTIPPDMQEHLESSGD